MPCDYRGGSPALERPAHPIALIASGRIRGMMEQHQLVGRCRGRELTLQPLSLDGIRAVAIWLVGVAIEDEKLYRAPGERVIALIAGKREIVEVGSGAGSVPVVVAQGRKELVLARRRPRTVRSLV